MNKILIGVVLAVLIIGGVVFVSNQKSPSQMNTQIPAQTQTQGTVQSNPTNAPEATKNAVTIKNFAFSPATLTVKVGDKVTWTNQDSVGHSATADDGSFDTGVLQQGQSGNATFNKAGTYAYHCSVHPTIKGTIIVQ